MGVDAALLALADLAQVIFLLYFEVERRVVEHEAAVAVGDGVVEARSHDGAAAAASCVLRRVRFRVECDAETLPSSAKTRSMSNRLVGSITRAMTKSRKTSSPTTSNPRLPYTPAKVS